MKKVLLGSTYNCDVYLVPDQVAKNLEKYCMEYCEWLNGTSPEAEKLRKKRRPCPDEEEFVEIYLNRQKFPNEKSVFVESLGSRDYRSPNIAFDYKDNPEYNTLPYFYF